MFDAWKSRDPDALAEVYGKEEAILNSDDELNSKLFAEAGPRHDCRQRRVSGDRGGEYVLPGRGRGPRMKWIRAATMCPA
ncbi:MAG: hypothetical protein ACLRWQ_24030 [Flavonifractor plautii]